MRAGLRSAFSYLLLGLALVLLFSALHTALEATHDCIGEHCPICAKLALNQIVRNGPLLTVTLRLLCAGFRPDRTEPGAAPELQAEAPTLVSLSIRFSE